MVWIKFLICVLIILFAGRRVARYGDFIAEKTGLGGAWIGTVLIAITTSLPELFTGISAVTLVNAPDLTVGNLLGANTFNLFNLALLDIVYRKLTIVSAVRRSIRYTAWFSLALVAIVAVFIAISRGTAIWGIGWIGWYTPITIILYLLFARAIFRVERRLVREEAKLRSVDYGVTSLRRGVLYFVLSAIPVIGAGVWLAMIGDEVALVTGWGQSFVGSLLIAFTTTLPEITVSFTAVRLGATDLAVANLIGSNLFNMTIIAIDDLLYTKGPILQNVSLSHVVTALTVIVMTLVFVAGLRFRRKIYFGLSWWSPVLVAVFLLGAYFSFVMAV